MRLARMCSDTVHARSHDHNRTAVTVFAASHNGSETRLWYTIDDLSHGLMRGFSSAYHHIARESEIGSPPDVRWCGHATLPRMYGCAWNRMVCHIRFSQPRLCSIELHWPQRRLTVTVQMCQRLPSDVSAGQARYVSACVPLYFSPSPALAAYSVGRLARWSRYMVSQADAVRVHVVAGATAQTRTALDLAVGDLLRSGQLHLRAWGLYESLQLRMPSTHQGTTFEQIRDRDADGELNPYRVFPLVQLKCMCEERDESEWVVLLDADELYKSVPPAPSRTLAQFLASLPTSQHQFLFCAVDEQCFRWRKDAPAAVRPKAAVRVSSDCVWMASAHYAFPLSDEPGQAGNGDGGAGCWQPHWVNDFERKCKSGPLSYYVSHQGDRVGSNFDENVDCNYQRLGEPEAHFRLGDATSSTVYRMGEKENLNDPPRSERRMPSHLGPS